MTKKILAVILVLACVSLAAAQTRKGTLLLGTSIGSGYAETSDGEGTYSTTSTIYKSSGNSFNIGLSPRIGYFVADNVAFGAEIDLSYSHSTTTYSESSSTSTDTSKYNSLYAYIGPFLQVYLGSPGGSGQPYVKVMAGLGMYPSYSGEYSSTAGASYSYTYTYDKYESYAASVEIGYEYFPNPSIGLIFYAGYSYSHYEYTYAYDYSVGTDYSATNKYNYGSFNFGVGAQIHLGPKS